MLEYWMIFVKISKNHYQKETWKSDFHFTRLQKIAIINLRNNLRGNLEKYLSNILNIFEKTRFPFFVLFYPVSKNSKYGLKIITINPTSGKRIEAEGA